jgi:hypothetical protein
MKRKVRHGRAYPTALDALIVTECLTALRVLIPTNAAVRIVVHRHIIDSTMMIDRSRLDIGTLSCVEHRLSVL